MRLSQITAVTALVLTSTLSAQEWFVRAGSTDGDGSQQKPFNDPWQALEKCQAGDTIHIAGGRYFGKLGVGPLCRPVAPRLGRNKQSG